MSRLSITELLDPPRRAAPEPRRSGPGPAWLGGWEEAGGLLGPADGDGGTGCTIFRGPGSGTGQCPRDCGSKCQSVLAGRRITTQSPSTPTNTPPATLQRSVFLANIFAPPHNIFSLLIFYHGMVENKRWKVLGNNLKPGNHLCS